MKNGHFFSNAALAALIIGAPVALSPLAPALAQNRTAVAETTTTVSVEQFRERLTPVGDYVQVEGLGEAWKPRDVAADWQPYSVGSWIFNDKVGWYFRSDEPWAEITYHYGRWYDDPDQGWVWVAGTEWGPAWVEWRRSKQFVGWRPLPPENAPRRVSTRTTTRNATTANRNRGSADRGGREEVVEEAWVFVPTERIVSEDIRTVRVERTRVVEIYEETRPLGRSERRGSVTVNFALQPEVIQRETRIEIRSQNLPRAVAVPVPATVREIATEERTTTTTSGTSTTGTSATGTTGTTTGTTGQPVTPGTATTAGQPPASGSNTATTAPGQPSAAGSNTATTAPGQPSTLGSNTATDTTTGPGARPPRAGTASSPNAQPGQGNATSTTRAPDAPDGSQAAGQNGTPNTRSTETTAPGANPGQAQQRRPGETGTSTSSTRPPASPNAPGQGTAPSLNESDKAQAPQNRGNQRQETRDQRRQERTPGQAPADNAAQSPASPSTPAPAGQANQRPSGSETTGQAQQRRPADSETTGATGGSGTEPLRRRAPAGGDAPNAGSAPAPERRSQNGDGQPTRSEARQDRGGAAASGGAEEATGSTPRRLPRGAGGQGSEGGAAAPNQ